MPLTRNEICAFLPHTGAMCLLDSVENWTRDEIVCRAASHRDPANPLRRDGALPAVSGVEYAAQAMGVHGRLVTPKEGKPGAGFLASVRGLELHVDRLDTVADDLTVRARRIADSGDSVMCEFEVSACGTSLLTGRATLFLQGQA
jgi:predicted hotdog family 3-hydroxylacyl-ACP dehydratase